MATRMRRTLAAIKEQLERRRHDAARPNGPLADQRGPWLAGLLRSARTTSTAWSSSTRRSRSSGVANFNVAANGASPAGRGIGWVAWYASTFLVRVSLIPVQTSGITPDSEQEPYEGILHVRICAGGRRQRRSLPRSSMRLIG